MTPWLSIIVGAVAARFSQKALRGRRVTIPELADFGTHYLGVRYIFWGTQEPYYSRDLLPFLQARGKRGNAPR